MSVVENSYDFTQHPIFDALSCLIYDIRWEVIFKFLKF